MSNDLLVWVYVEFSGDRPVTDEASTPKDRHNSMRELKIFFLWIFFMLIFILNKKRCIILPQVTLFPYVCCRLSHLHNSHKWDTLEVSFSLWYLNDEEGWLAHYFSRAVHHRQIILSWGWSRWSLESAGVKAKEVSVLFFFTSVI